jgi:hypothetical protein
MLLQRKAFILNPCADMYMKVYSSSYKTSSLEYSGTPQLVLHVLKQ